MPIVRKWSEAVTFDRFTRCSPPRQAPFTSIVHFVAQNYYLYPMTWLRSAFQDELDGVTQTLTDLSTRVSEAITQATHALLTANITEAEAVIASDDQIDDIQHDLDARIIDIIARQQPVASDLRALVTALRMSADLERMGDMAHHIAKITRLRHPGAAVPSELLLTIEEMGKVARSISDKVGGVINSRDIETALEIGRAHV